MEYVQLEFDFTWFQFCDLIDTDTGDVVGGAFLECNLAFTSNGVPFFVVASFVLDEYEYSPFFPLCHDSAVFFEKIRRC